ncbi:MAG: phosphoribosylamine---glycine ligase [Bacillota bacterium]|nr:phosphoribosylamine---glycine ligase [Bacillota bacterium]
MKVLVVGAGGREHALVWKLAQSPRVKKVYCAPGNAGTAELAENVPIGATDVATLTEWAAAHDIDLTVVGPEAPLTAGLVDAFRARGLSAYGPTRKAAAIEGSKVFSKNLMHKYGIPTAEYRVFTEAEEARRFVRAKGAPLVLKAEGLAAGKGVIVALTEEEALDAIHTILEEQAFGAAGERLIIEEYLEGEEVTVLAFADGEHVLMLAPSQDHKRAFDGDQGPNTGGMGAYSPVPALTPDTACRVEAEILRPTVAALAAEGSPYRGVLYAGLMLTAAGPKVLEFNARFGDPEAQAVLPRLATDLVEVAEATLAGRLDRISLAWRPTAALAVVLASGGYPGHYETGFPIQGLKEAAAQPDTLVFHAGTRREGNQVVTAGGRVLAVTALGSDLKAARERAYQAVEMIRFSGRRFRRDIGWRALRS